MSKLKPYIALLLIVAIAAGAAGCAGAKAADLMGRVPHNRVDGKDADAAFAGSMADFSVELFKKSASGDENSLVSPLSVMLALAMTANGAGGETLSQMEALLGGGIALDDLNEYLYSYAKGLPSGKKSKLSIANSIWFRDDENRLRVDPGFLQKNADYYGAAAYKAPFDKQTLKDINNWVSKNTDGMIDAILNNISDTEVMYLINAIAFDAEWKEIYINTGVRPDVFTDVHGKGQKVDFMHSDEDLYLDDGMAVGFVKPYVGGYSFAALLPNEGVSIDAYIESLTGARLLETLSGAQSATVQASMPKFKYEYGIEMSGILAQLGMPDAFDQGSADFSGMVATATKALYISRVLHKAFISVDERGTKAGAATVVAMADGAAPMQKNVKTVRLDRPFVYAIIDNATNLPIFIGAVMTVA